MPTNPRLIEPDKTLRRNGPPVSLKEGSSYYSSYAGLIKIKSVRVDIITYTKNDGGYYGFCRGSAFHLDIRPIPIRLK